MSTSLQQQLKRLKTAPTQSLSVERDYSSLLFDKQEAASHSRDDFYKIGLAGLLYIKQHFDHEFDDYEPNLFKKSMLDFNRTSLSKEEEELLNTRLERIIILLAPYFHHQAAKQVLEWLIFRYQIHLYKSETLALALLPYHSTNSYGRLLNILRFNNIEWNFTKEFAKGSSSIPMHTLIRVCRGSHTYLLSSIFNFITNAIEVVGSDYIEKRLHHYFTFIVALFTNLTEEPSQIDNEFISRIVPFLATALKSKILPFKYAGLMISCNLVMNITLVEEVANSILCLILSKARKPWFEIALQTSVVILQRLKLTALPRKPIIKLVRKKEELELSRMLSKLMDNYDMTSFIVPFWKVLFVELNKETLDDELSQEIFGTLVETMDVNRLGGEQVRSALTATFGLYNNKLDNQSIDDNNGTDSKPRIPKSFRKNIRTMAIRFPDEFDKVRNDWLVQNKQVVSYLMVECEIKEHEVGLSS